MSQASRPTAARLPHLPSQSPIRPKEERQPPMQLKTDSAAMLQARELTEARIDAEAMIQRLSLRGTSAQARRLAICEQNNPHRAAAWQRLAMLMGSLAPARLRI